MRILSRHLHSQNFDIATHILEIILLFKLVLLIPLSRAIGSETPHRVASQSHGLFS